MFVLEFVMKTMLKLALLVVLFLKASTAQDVNLMLVKGCIVESNFETTCTNKIKFLPALRSTTMSFIQLTTSQDWLITLAST